MSDMSVDRVVLRGMVEDFWRSYVLFMRDLQVKYPRAGPEELSDECLEFSRRHWQRFEAMAALMAPEQAQAFMQIIDEEDSICSREHHSQPARFYDRLGLNWPSRTNVSLRERDAFYRKHGLDPKAVDAVLGSPDPGLPIPAGPQPAVPTYRRQGIGEMAFRTAIRATVWETIRSLFRR